MADVATAGVRAQLYAAIALRFSSISLPLRRTPQFFAIVCTTQSILLNAGATPTVAHIRLRTSRLHRTTTVESPPVDSPSVVVAASVVVVAAAVAAVTAAPAAAAAAAARRRAPPWPCVGAPTRTGASAGERGRHQEGTLATARRRRNVETAAAKVADARIRRRRKVATSAADARKHVSAADDRT